MVNVEITEAHEYDLVGRIISRVIDTDETALIIWRYRLRPVAVWRLSCRWRSRLADVGYLPLVPGTFGSLLVSGLLLARMRWLPWSLVSIHCCYHVRRNLGRPRGPSSCRDEKIRAKWSLTKSRASSSRCSR